MDTSTGTTGGTASLRGAIDELLRADAAELAGNAPSAVAQQGTQLPPFLVIQPMDYEKEKNKATEMAKRSMNALLKFYLKEDIIDNNEYIQLRAKMATMQLSVLLNQIQTSEHAITTLLKQIHAGAFIPRAFEVLAVLQKTLLDTMKLHTMQMIANEESFKRLRADLDHEPSQTQITSGDGKSARGTRDLMREVQSEIQADFESDGETEEDEE